MIKEIKNQPMPVRPRALAVTPTMPEKSSHPAKNIMGIS
jgi:hypothetical protein